MKTTDLTRLDQTVFYALEKAIKSYRQFAQRNINRSHLAITIDQWLVLKTIKDQPELTQMEMAEKVFKDYASITRIIDLLVQKKYLERSPHPEDRRRKELKLTRLGEQTYLQLVPIIRQNREQALKGLAPQEREQLHQLLQKIITNCHFD